MFATPFGVTIAGALALAAGLSALAFRHRIEAIPMPLFERPAPSGPRPVARVSAVIPLASMGKAGLPAGVWYPAATDQPFPLVIYLPGWGNPQTDNTLLGAELASHGYVVVALDDVSHALPPPPLRDPRDTGRFDLSSDAALAHSMDIANWRLRRMIARVSELIDWLSAHAQASPTSPIPVRVDTSRIAVVGFSFGGSAAIELTKRDPRISAAVNMDGMAFGDSAASGWDKPVLIFNSDYPQIAADSRSTEPSRRLTASLTLADRALQLRAAGRGPTFAYLFRNVEHDDFTDELFTPPLAAILETFSKSASDRLRLRRATNRLVLAFLEIYLACTRTTPPGLEEELSGAGIELLANSTQVPPPP